MHRPDLRLHDPVVCVAKIGRGHVTVAFLSDSDLQDILVAETLKISHLRNMGVKLIAML